MDAMHEGRNSVVLKLTRTHPTLSPLSLTFLRVGSSCDYYFHLFVKVDHHRALGCFQIATALTRID